jgi:cupin 2 domain-containing protein
MNDIMNLFESIPDQLSEELIQTLLSTQNLRIERIVSRGQASPEGFWHDQIMDEWVLLIAGAAQLRFEGEVPINLVPGSFLNIPAHKRHRVEWTDQTRPTIWLAVHYASDTKSSP